MSKPETSKVGKPLFDKEFYYDLTKVANQIGRKRGYFPLWKKTNDGKNKLSGFENRCYWDQEWSEIQECRDEIYKNANVAGLKLFDSAIAKEFRKENNYNGLLKEENEEFYYEIIEKMAKEYGIPEEGPKRTEFETILKEKLDKPKYEVQEVGLRYNVFEDDMPVFLLKTKYSLKDIVRACNYKLSDIFEDFEYEETKNDGLARDYMSNYYDDDLKLTICLQESFNDFIENIIKGKKNFRVLEDAVSLLWNGKDNPKEFLSYKGNFDFVLDDIEEMAIYDDDDSILSFKEYIQSKMFHPWAKGRDFPRPKGERSIEDDDFGIVWDKIMWAEAPEGGEFEN